MTNYVKNYRKIAITKDYDLLELKANGRIDADGDYLDDEGNKLTLLSAVGIGGFLSDYAIQYGYHYEMIRHVVGASCMEHIADKSQDEILPTDGFICIGVAGEKWCVRRDIFLATYEEVK